MCFHGVVSTLPAPCQRTASHFPTRAVIAAGVLAGVVAVSGCGGSSAPGPTSSPSASAQSSAAASAGDVCAAVSAPLSAIDARNPGEPRLLIPQPAGWERNTSLDSEVIRYVLSNRSLVAESFAPTVVVTLEHVPGTGATPQQLLDQQRTTLESQGGATDLTVQPTTICGATAETIDYMLPPQGAVAARPARVLLVAAPYGDDTWTATVTTQAINADDPTYRQDSSAMLDGFEMLPPAR